ncbi:MAG TPA: metal-dependent hydrolase [Alphaproteobacteria bacterium]|nr:metal-dependent hydrolase [Alphaproteobacteria bacterium]
MATPVGHSLLGFAIGKLTGGSGAMSPWRWYAFCAVAANAPDLDFLPGLFAGDVNRFHQSASHSLVAALIFGLAVALVALLSRHRVVRGGIAGVGLYASHLLLDLFGEDNRAPFGIFLLWPFSSQYFTAPWSVFEGVKHGVPGEDLSTFVGHVFSWANVGVVALEIVTLSPFLLLTWYVTRRPMRDHQLNNRSGTFGAAEQEGQIPNVSSRLRKKPAPGQ